MATFGKTGIGASSLVQATNTRVGTIYTLPVNGTVSKLTVYFEPNSFGETYRPVIYAASGTTPGAFVATGAERNISTGGGNAWYDFPLASPTSMAAGDYILGVWATIGPGSGDNSFYDAGSAGTGHLATDTYSSSTNPADPWGSDTASTRNFSIYATYTPAAVPSTDVLNGPVLMELLKGH